MDSKLRLNDLTSFNKLSLEKIKVALDINISEAQFRNFDIESYKDSISDSIIYKLRGFLMGERLREEKINWKVSYPSSWWEMFKERYFTKRLLNKFPVKYTTKKRNVTFKVYELYPKLPIAIPKYTDRHFPIQFCEFKDKESN